MVKEGIVVVTNPQELNNLGECFNNDYDSVEQSLVDELNKGDDDEEMAQLLGY